MFCGGPRACILLLAAFDGEDERLADTKKTRSELIDDTK